MALLCKKTSFMTIRPSAPAENSSPNWNPDACDRDSHHDYACYPRGTGQFLMGLPQADPGQGPYFSACLLDILNMFGADGIDDHPKPFFVEMRAGCKRYCRNSQKAFSCSR
jgi:hypothetical protein